MGKNSSSTNLMSQGSRQEIKTQAIILATFVAIFWLLEILDQFVFRGSLDYFGIIPHQVIGLRGILFAPFLHGDFPHLIANTVPFLILGWLVMLQETSDFFIVTGLTMLVGGLGVWLFATPGSIHIGASILIFGYLGFLLLRGYFQRNIPSILLSILVFLLYGGTIWGVLPSRPGISWQGHLFGFLGGVLAAKLIATEKKHYP
ncbi:MAG: rhomboid family intramembrane serine protease [Microcystis sp. M54BS1]|nr:MULTISPECIES: rhomboid family intramembrane serine protease [Microcystis]MBE5227628.1 rhomboid family intramembrane serine protease [Microcystis aeruginosa PMC 728.11]MCA2537910.1 rhomboid family intramembrane serine protease [Microcystis sp. M54BS1]MCA2594163.1 rhomboid family intramembrane serine protease [Microcystis sp. M38BS1]MCA2611273.1 rhomboid family intramembrane serine protease [Microcystis sp. M27BS1]MCA2505344.1 rhomboid family intramembrane serine protease [Microcystis sp. M62